MATHLAWRMSKQVSIKTASTPSSMSATSCEVGVDGFVENRRHFGPRPDRADGEPRPVRRAELPHRLARQAHVEPVQLVHLVAEAELGEDELAAVKRVCLDGVAAGGEEAAVDFPDPLGARVRQGVGQVDQVFPTPVGDGRVVAVQAGPHRAVEDEDAAVEPGEKVVSHQYDPDGREDAGRTGAASLTEAVKPPLYCRR
jgi:hypothetical protein